MKLFFCLTPTLPLATMKFNPQLLISAQSKVHLLCHDIFIPTDWNKVEKYVNIKIWYNFCKLLAQQTNMLCTFFNIRVSPTTKFLQLLGLIKISPQSFKMSLYNAIALFCLHCNKEENFLGHHHYPKNKQMQNLTCHIWTQELIFMTMLTILHWSRGFHTRGVYLSICSC